MLAHHAGVLHEEGDARQIEQVVHHELQDGVVVLLQHAAHVKYDERRGDGGTQLIDEESGHQPLERRVAPHDLQARNQWHTCRDEILTLRHHGDGEPHCERQQDQRHGAHQEQSFLRTAVGTAEDGDYRHQLAHHVGAKANGGTPAGDP